MDSLAEIVRKIEALQLPEEERRLISYGMQQHKDRLTGTNEIVSRKALAQVCGYHHVSSEGEALKFNSTYALYSWSLTRKVYIFDPDLAENLWKTPLTEISEEILDHLPCPVMFLSIPDIAHPVLYCRICPEFSVVGFGEWTAKIHHQTILKPRTEWAAKAQEASKMFTQERAEQIRKVFLCVLYLATEEKDVVIATTKKVKSYIKIKRKTKKKPAYVYNVGYQLGQTIRKEKQLLANATEKWLPTGAKGLRPHWRSAHFKTVRIGPKPKSPQDPPQNHKTVWIHGVYVNANKTDNNAPMILHPVKP